jgi:hypothetical protein
VKSLATRYEKNESDNPIDTREAVHHASSMSNHLWFHLQKNLLNRPTPSLQALAPRVTRTLTHSDTDEILEDTDTEDDELAG